MAYLGLSRRVALDIEEIERFSVEKWGRRVADEYMDSIQDSAASCRRKGMVVRSIQPLQQALNARRSFRYHGSERRARSMEFKWSTK